jgi:tRNA1Val (adenine37-N6)-methyltransferase
LAIHDLLHYQGLSIQQTPNTFHFSLDSLLLAYYAPVASTTKHIIDLCSGNAPVPLFLSLKTKATIIGIELQSEAYNNAVASVAMNQKEEQITMFQADVKGVYKTIGHDRFDLVTVNPPYYATINLELVSKTQTQALARHEISLTLEDVFNEAAKLLKNKGLLCIIQRVERLNEMLELCTQTNLVPKSLRFVHPFIHESANVVLLIAKKGAKPGSLEVLPPVITHEADGSYTTQINAIYHYGS